MFEGSNRGGADSDDATRGAERLVDGIGCIGGDGVRLGMNRVIFDALDADGLESSQADVQGDLDRLDPTLADAVEDFRSEMQAGGGGRYRPARLRIDGLIAVAIAGRIGARDIRRERDVADAIEHGEEIADWLKADAALAELCSGENLGLQVAGVPVAEKQAFADADLAARANQAFPIVGIGGELAGQQNLDAAVQEIPSRRIPRADRLSAGAFAAAIEARRKHAGIVENYNIADMQQSREVTEQPVCMATGSLQVEHAGAVPGGQRFLGNEVFWKIKIEVGNQHGLRL
jgi:hypothetical protein